MAPPTQTPATADRKPSQSLLTATIIKAMCPALSAGQARDIAAACYGTDWKTLAAQPGKPALPHTQARVALRDALGKHGALASLKESDLDIMETWLHQAVWVDLRAVKLNPEVRPAPGEIMFTVSPAGTGKTWRALTMGEQWQHGPVVAVMERQDQLCVPEGWTLLCYRTTQAKSLYEQILEALEQGQKVMLVCPYREEGLLTEFCVRLTRDLPAKTLCILDGFNHNLPRLTLTDVIEQFHFQSTALAIYTRTLGEERELLNHADQILLRWQGHTDRREYGHFNMLPLATRPDEVVVITAPWENHMRHWWERKSQVEEWVRHGGLPQFPVPLTKGNAAPDEPKPGLFARLFRRR